MTDNIRAGQCSICGETSNSQTDQSEVPNDTKETFFRHGLGLFCSPGNDCNCSYRQIRGFKEHLAPLAKTNTFEPLKSHLTLILFVLYKFWSFLTEI